MQHFFIEGTITKHGVTVTETRGSGTNLVTFRLAVQSGFGKFRRTDYFHCIAFGASAGLIAKHYKPHDVFRADGAMRNSPFKKDENGFDIPNWQFVVRNVYWPIKSSNDNEQEEQATQNGFGVTTADDFAVIEDGEDLPF